MFSVASNFDDALPGRLAGLDVDELFGACDESPPEDLDRHRAAGVAHFKIVDRSCSSDALVERVRAYHARRWDGDLLELLGPRGAPPRTRPLPVLDALRHLGLRRAVASLRDARQLIDPSLPWIVDNRRLETTADGPNRDGLTGRPYIGARKSFNSSLFSV